MEERSKYFDANLEDVVKDANEVASKHCEESRSLKVVERLQPLVTAIEQYGQALDVYANAYPLVLSPLWGSLRIVLLVRSPLTLSTLSHRLWLGSAFR